MRRGFPAISVFALLTLSSPLLPAQNVFVLPALSGSTTPTVFTADPFNQAAVLSTAPPNASFALSANGKFYLVSNTNSNTVQVTDASFTSLHAIAGGDLAGAVAAAVSPDGKHLFVVSSGGLVSIVDTSTDKVSQTSLYYNGPVLDLAPSLDSSRLYVLVTPSSGAQVAIADSTTGASNKSVNVPGTATGLSVAPSGLVYVSTRGAILEYDPANFGLRYTVSVSGRPGKLYFTPDGKTGIAANLDPSNGTAAFVIDMTSHTVKGTIPEGSPSVTLDQLFPVGNNRVIGYSSQAKNLFDLTLDTLTLAPFSYSSAGGVTGAAVSNTLPTATNANTQFLYFTSGTTVYRVDLNAGQITGQQTISGNAGAVVYTAQPVRNGTPAAILTYGDNQTIGTNSASAPLVVKVVDANGNPLANVPVSFSTSTPGVSFSSAGVFSDNLGNASTTVTGTTAGTVTINVTAGTLSSSFTINIATSGGGTGGNSSGGFSIVAGQGQVVPSSTRASFAGSLLTVQLLDQSGAPMPNQSIVFTLQSGQGTLCDASGGCGQTTLTELTSNCTAGATGCVPGQASIDFVGPFLSPQTPDYVGASITATAPSGNSVTFYLNTVATGTQAQPTLVNFSAGTTITAQAGQKLVGALQTIIQSQTGDPIPNVGLSVQNQDPTKPAPASCVGTFALSDTKGKSSCDLIATAAPGTYPITVNVGYTRSYNLTLVVTPGAPSNLSVVSGDKQSGSPGQKLSPLTVLVTDAGGSPQSGISVTWSVTPAAGATLSSTTSVTDSQGHASTTPTLGNTTGNVTVQATVGTLAPKTFTLTVTVPASAIQLVSGSGQSAALNAAFAAPIVVKVVDANGNALSGIPVAFSANNGASVGSSSVSTKSDGTASTTVTAGGTAGTVTVTARAGTQSVTATLTVVPPGPSNIVFMNGASFQTGTIAPGEIVTIQGNGLAANVQGIATPANIVGPLPTTFQGVTVTFNGTAAPIFSVSNVNGVQQVVVQAPFELTGSTSATVNITTSGGGTATISNVAIQAFAPGIFETTVFGQKQAVALHADGSYVSPANPATRGENITIFLTGLGQTTPATGTNRAGVAGQTVVASIVGGINNAGVPVVSVQAAPGLIGVYALTLTIPSDTQSGPAQQVQAIAYDPAGNSYYAQGSVIPIQ